jgi:hypothetical protein
MHAVKFASTFAGLFYRISTQSLVLIKGGGLECRNAIAFGGMLQGCRFDQLKSI